MPRLAVRTGKLISAVCMATTALASVPARAGFNGVDYESRVRKDIEVLTACGSRVAGYPGAQKAEQYVRQRLEGLGYTNLTVQEFDIVSPVDRGCSLEVEGGRSLQLYSVWPNLVCTSTVIPGEVDGPVVYAGQGYLEEMNGSPIDGAIVLMDFNCGTRWLNAAMLGASAVVFIEPDETTRQDAEEKFSRVPVDFPRFYITQDEVAELLARVKRSEPGAVRARISARVDWVECPVRTFIALLPGSDPELARESIVLQAYYDSMSVVPAIAPGAEQACTMAGFLAIAEALAKDPPARSVVLVASPGHFAGLAGMCNLADVFGAKGRRKKEQDEFYLRSVREMEKDIARIEAGLADTRDRQQRIARLARSTDPEDVKRYQLELTARGPVDFDSNIRRAERQVQLLRQKIQLMERFRREEHIPLVVSLDLTSHSRQFGLAFASHFFADSAVIRFLSPLGKRFSAIAEEVAREYGWDFDRLWFDGANPKQEKNWWDYFPGRPAFESDMILRVGRPAITFATGSDTRPLFDTPLDTIESVDTSAVAFQAEMLADILTRFLNDRELDQTAFKRTKRLKLPYRLTPLKGRVLEFVRRSSFLPQTPVPDALVLVRGGSKCLMGVRTDTMTFADGAGLFTIQGHQNGWVVDAYYLDPVTGDIRYAPDLGPEGERKFTRSIWQRGRQDRPVIVFPCEPLAIYDLVDQRYLETLEQVFVYDAKTNAEPLSFGYEVPIFTPPAGETGLAVEPCAVIFTAPEQSVKVTLGMGLLGARMLLLNSTPENPEGLGYRASDGGRVPLTVYRAASDMHILNAKRIADFVTKGVKNPQVEGLHSEAGARLEAVPEHLEKREYDRAVALARAAWAYESSAYPNVQKTARDVIYGVVFYLALLLSFTYFAERLVIAAPTVQGRVLWTVGIFISIFIVLRMVHPAFDLAVNPFIILLAFVVLALAVLVTSIVVTKFNEQLERLKQELGGIHKADVSRMSAATMAFGLGVANMRRRPTRTALTCVTLVLVTFTVLSFTSVRSGVKINRLPRQENPAYTGIMLRDKVWVQLEDTIPEVMQNEWKERGYVVSPRGWQVSGDITKKANYELSSRADPTVKYTVHSILGLAPQERSISGLDASLLEGGRWFVESDRQVVILPATVAEGLGIKPDHVARSNALDAALLDTRASHPRPRSPAGAIAAKIEAMGDEAPVISFGGDLYLVIGIIPNADLEAFRDLDNESIIPVDFSQLKPEVLNQVREMASQRYKLGRLGVASLLQDYQHFLGDGVMILPYSQCLRTGGTTRSVAMAIPSVEETEELVDEYMQRLAVSIYATGNDGGKPRVFLHSSIGSQSLDGVETVLIPVLIAALIVLNTMLGSVWERVKEIHVFSSVGLSPTHVGALFLAESCVYANIGAILGYLLGQGVTKILIMSDSLGAVQTNYSSMSAVFSTVIVLITVLLSTLWPARKAAQIAVPDIERRWKLPEPDGDEMNIPMPFTVTGRDAPAANAFLTEFFEAYVGYAGGDFYTEGVSLRGITCEHGDGYSLSLKIWLAPYDLGVSQTVELLTEPTGEYNIYQLSIKIHREAGDISSWKKTNWLFLNLIRKQFLIWRTIPVEQKEGYARRALELVSGTLSATALPHGGPVAAVT